MMEQIHQKGKPAETNAAGVDLVVVNDNNWIDTMVGPPDLPLTDEGGSNEVEESDEDDGEDSTEMSTNIAEDIFCK